MMKRPLSRSCRPEQRRRRETAPKGYELQRAASAGSAHRLPLSPEVVAQTIWALDFLCVNDKVPIPGAPRNRLSPGAAIVIDRAPGALSGAVEPLAPHPLARSHPCFRRWRACLRLGDVWIVPSGLDGGLAQTIAFLCPQAPQESKRVGALSTAPT